MLYTPKKFLSVTLLSIISLSLFIIPNKAVAATCALSFTISADKSSVQSGGTITRTVIVKNTGKNVCKNVSFSLYYSDYETFVSSTPKARAGNYYFVPGTLTAGASNVTTIVTKHNGSSTSSSVDLEGCATATGAIDACATSSVMITSGNASPVVPTVPVATTTPPVTTATPTPSMPTNPPVSSNKKEQGMWIWNFPGDMLSAAAQSQMKQLSTYGFNAVYITIDDYLDIASMPAGSTKDANKIAYFNNLALFVKNANALGMQVDAEGGWKDWAKPENRWKGYALIDAVKEYNVLHPEAKLRGLQYDVEPYLLPEYEGDKGPVLLDFVTFIDQSQARLAGSNIKLSLAIPHFYDSVNNWTPTITYGGKTIHAFNHLLNILDKQGGGTILLMSYRNTFDGTNGTRAISETEIKQASAGYKTTVIVGQETGDVDPAYVTFFGKTKSEVMSAATTINSAFQNYSNYGGVAIHYLDSFLQMRQ